MANNTSVWGIEIGQAALKALRCRRDGDQVVAEAFDYIEYPKMLSQPEAEPAELIAEALEKFRERNDSRSHEICMSVPGQSGLAKFFKPPPVETKKIADLVRYEAKQQIPFDLEDVVWDYQMMPGSTVEEGYALESEVGLFAMKREMVTRLLLPLETAGIEIDLIQLAPMAIYNMVAHDRMHERISGETFDADNPPPSSVILSIGTDSSDLVITNGFRIWQRSMPIGGNHFTRQLTKDLKLTFAKAEHLKRNAREAVDPKLVFQTMRPVFNDMVTEVQRSIGFFRSIHRKAEINELLIAGNTVKMPGLAGYIGKNLGLDVHVLDRFNRLDGEDVLSIPAFRDNAPTFAVCYGLCLQGLGMSQLTNSLVPREIVVQRIIRAKRPWALAAVATLMLGMTAHYWFAHRSYAKTQLPEWQEATSVVDRMSSHSSRHVSEDGKYKSKLDYLDMLGVEISSNAERRLRWLEVLRALNATVVRTDFPDGKPPSPKELPFEDRPDIHITELDSKYHEDLSTWFTDSVARRYREELRNWASVMRRDPPTAEELAAVEPPEGAGWVLQLRGYHYYNSTSADRLGTEGSNHVRKHLITALREKPIPLPNKQGEMIDFLPDEIGFSHVLLVDDNRPREVSVPNPDFDPEIHGRRRGAGQTGVGRGTRREDDDQTEPPNLDVLRHDFIVQLVWKPNTISERMAIREEKAELEAEQAEEEDVAQDPDAVAQR